MTIVGPAFGNVTPTLPRLYAIVASVQASPGTKFKKATRDYAHPLLERIQGMTLIGILVLIAIIWLLVVLLGGLPTWLLLLLIVLVIVWFVGGRGRAA